MELIDFAEQQGLANYQWQQRVNETTRQESNITLGFVITGGAACMAWSVNRICSAQYLASIDMAVLGTGLWLFVLAAFVQFRCVGALLSSPPANHPLNLYKPEFDTNDVRKIQLEYLEKAILHAIENGQKKAKALARIRVVACFTPLFFLTAWALLATLSCCFPKILG